MKIEIEQPKLVELIEMLCVDGLIPYPVMEVKEDNKTLFSSQFIPQSPAGELYRYLGVDRSFFKKLQYDDQPNVVKLMSEKLLKFVKSLPSTSTIRISTEQNTLILETDEISLSTKTPSIDETEHLKGFPFKMENETPYLMKGTVPLENHVIVPYSSFKQLTSYESIIQKPVYLFELNEAGFNATLREEHGLSDVISYGMKAKVANRTENAKVAFTVGMKELAGTFSQDIHIRLKTNFPVWFYEKSQNYFLGVLMNPKII